MKRILRIAFPLLLGCAILWWMYREFDFSRVRDVLFDDMSWGWMLLSLVPGALAMILRGLRWVQTLEPLDEHPRRSTCIHAIFLSYMTSLVVPRLGEVSRCGVLKRYDGVSFSKAIGTVVTERIVDSLLLLLITSLVFLTQIPIFMGFFRRTGTNIGAWLNTFTPTGWFVTLSLLLITLIFVWLLLRRFGVGGTLSKMISDVKDGMFSLRDVRNLPLFTVYTLGIWVCYFLHFYLTFFAFTATSHLSITAGLVAFIACTLAVVVPTPNGMGSFHFAVKTILVLYGVETTMAESFVLIVHAFQTLLIPLLGIYSMLALSHRKPATTPTNPQCTGSDTAVHN
jgi:uncharacterized protein (TIRG00374 family)